MKKSHFFRFLVPPSRFCQFHATILSLSPILNSFFSFSSVSYDKITLLGFIFDDLLLSHDYVVLILHRLALIFLSFPILFIEFFLDRFPFPPTKCNNNRAQTCNRFPFFVCLIFDSGTEL